MPMKFDPDTWTQIRDRVVLLMSEGVSAAEAAARVSMERGGHPASGTIMNRLRNGWKSPSETPSATDEPEMRELRIQLQRAMDGIADRDEIIEKQDREIERLKRDLSETQQRAARAEGERDTLREIAEPRIRELRKATHERLHRGG